MKKLAVILLALVLPLTSVSALADTLLIAIPNDGTNLSRGIKLLEATGLIEVDPAAGYTPEIKDVTKYVYDIEIEPVDANTLTSTLEEYAGATINGTFATAYGLVPSIDGLIIEKQSEAGDNPYVNIIAARTDDAENPLYQTIIEAYHSQLVAEFLLTFYKEAYYPQFDYEADFSKDQAWVDAVAQYTADPDDESSTPEREYCKALAQYESDPKGKTVVKVGVVGASNEQWTVVQKVLDERDAGIYIQLEIFDKYTTPNDSLNAGEVDLNAFQHKAFLNNEINQHGYTLTPIADTLIAPLTLYSKNFASVDAIKDAAGLKN